MPRKRKGTESAKGTVPPDEIEKAVMAFESSVDSSHHTTSNTDHHHHTSGMGQGAPPPYTPLDDKHHHHHHHHPHENHHQPIVQAPTVVYDSGPGLEEGLAMYVRPDPPRPAVVNQQPTAFTVSGNMPVSMEYLKTVTSLTVKQHVEMLEVLTGIETENRFTIFNEAGQTVFYAKERSDFCSRQCCGPSRAFDMEISDMYQQVVIHLQRPLRCSYPLCCFCCLNTMEICSPPGTVIGTVDQTFSFLTPNYAIKNEMGDVIFRVRSPICACSCGSDVVFEITSEATGETIGEIRKKWAGFVMELFTDADNFSITFPRDLDVKMKAVLLGALFLIDIMLFERKKNNNR